MSVRKRWVLAAVTVGLWVAWLLCASVHHEDVRMHLLGECIRTLFIVAAVSLVLTCLVTPMATVLNIGRQIGRVERGRECACHERQAVVTPIRSLRPER